MASCTCTVMAGEIEMFDVELLGFWMNTSFVGTATTPNAPVVTVPRPVAEAVSW